MVSSKPEMDTITALAVYGADQDLASMAIQLDSRARDIDALARNNAELRETAAALRKLAHDVQRLRSELLDVTNRAYSVIYP